MAYEHNCACQRDGLYSIEQQSVEIQQNDFSLSACPCSPWQKITDQTFSIKSDIIYLQIIRKGKNPSTTLKKQEMIPRISATWVSLKWQHIRHLGSLAPVGGFSKYGGKEDVASA